MPAFVSESEKREKKRLSSSFIKEGNGTLAKGSPGADVKKRLNSISPPKEGKRCSFP